MAKKKRLSRAQRKLLHEMAHDERVIFLQKHPRRWMDIRYAINSFPMRTLHATMVNKLVMGGYLVLHKRGHYILTAKGQLEATVTETRKRI